MNGVDQSWDSRGVWGAKQDQYGVSNKFREEMFIKPKIQSQEQAISNIEQAITANNNTSQAYIQLYTLVQTMQSSADVLRGRAEIGAGNIDVFDSNTVSMDCSNGTPASNYLMITTENGVEISSFTITIQQVATALVEQSWYFASNTTSVVAATATTGEFTAGTFSLNGINITLTTGDTLLDVAAAINAQSSLSNVSALVIQTAPAQYRLIMQSTLTGVANAYTISDPSNVLNGLFSTNTTYDPNPIVQAAQDAIFTWNGVSITSPLNVISTVVPNLTFTLLQPTAGSTISVNVSPNVTAINNDITAFITAYNAIMNFYSAQTARGPDNMYLSTAILANDPILNSIVNGLTPLLLQTVPLLTSYNTLGSIGISYPGLQGYISGQSINVSNNLVINQTTLSSILTTNCSNVQSLFECIMTSSSSNLLLGIQRGNYLTVNALTFNINVANTANPVTVTYTPSGGSATTINTTFVPNVPTDYTKGGNIIGLAGTILQDFQFVYLGTGTETINVSIIQGIADQVFNFLQAFSLNGDFNNAQNQLQISTKNYSLQLQNKQQVLAAKRKALMKQFANIEIATQKAEQLQMMLQAERDFRARRYY